MASAPFSYTIFLQGKDAIQQDNPILPAVWRTPKGNLESSDIGSPSLPALLQQELLVDRLEAIIGDLWIAGRPVPPRPLHHHALLKRTIHVTERMDLHLVWHKDRIFIKPMPRFLLDPRFWTRHIKPGRLRKAAHGYLFSYAALITHESDFRLAQTHGLLPQEIIWKAWHEFVHDLLQNTIYADISPRYYYGELRLGRLNAIYRFHRGHLLRGYSSVAASNDYTSFLVDNYATLATLLAYALVLLQAMQVGLGTSILNAAKPFQQISYGFTVFVIAFTVLSTLIGGVVVVFAFLANWVSTTRFQEQRFLEMKVPQKDEGQRWIL
ncbi:hypothetical protein LTR62_005632 [Meristemomyces frigidus]|uniref:Uncharacterized protein n=1 Tax=Meristemomyces frigidus TaxID=1508187 RepID=A0AAN7YF64_9PEZI|nr:hypothetical protein LTR62_005632 [Meristemomyces frigidus]